MQHLAFRYSEAGKRQKSLQLMEQVVEGYKKILGEEHPLTLRSIHNIAINFSEVGERRKALQLIKRVVETRGKNNRRGAS